MARRPKPSPTARRQLDEMAELVRACFDDPAVAAPLVQIRGAAARFGRARSDATRTKQTIALVKAVGDAAVATVQRHPELVQALGPGLLLQLLLTRGVAADLLPARLRLHGAPSQPDRNPWLLIDAGDVAALRRLLQPGQIWVDATSLTMEEYRELWGLVTFNQQAGLGRQPKPGGRPRGSTVARD